MAPHFGTYHWSKNTVQGCQNIVQGCKMVFGTPFLATPLGVALTVFLFGTDTNGLVSCFSKLSWIIVFEDTNIFIV